MKKLFILFSIITSISLSAQQNYEWLKIKKYKVAELDDKIEENSALSFLGNRLFTLNDSGHPAELHEIDFSTGKTISSTKIDSIRNFDWEALTNDGNYFYIGDIGNNWGVRKDLKIYRVSTDSLQYKGEILYHYPEQTDFTKKPQANNWDAESLIHIDGKLNLFTKEWESYRTTRYEIPTTIQNEKIGAQKLEDFDLGYASTDAAYFDGKLYIVGYTKKTEVFLTIFNEDENGLFFTQKPKKFYLGSSTAVGQIEGISVSADGIYISGERFSIKPFNVPQTLYFIPHNRMEKALK